MYSDRYFYNNSFVNTEVLQTHYVRSMLSLCKYVGPNMSFAGVLKHDKCAATGWMEPQCLDNRVRKVKNNESKNCVKNGKVSVNTFFGQK